MMRRFFTLIWLVVCVETTAALAAEREFETKFINERVVIDEPQVWDGIRVVLGPDSEIIVRSDLEIRRSRIDAVVDPFQVAAGAKIKLERGGLSVVGTQIEAVAASPVAFEAFTQWRGEPLYTAGPGRWLVSADASLSGKIQLLDSKFRSSSRYLLGALYVAPEGKTRVIVEGSYFEGFHGVIYFGNGGSTVVRKNKFKRNSFGNVVGGGSNILISENLILFPGNGTSGDGITLNDAQNALIFNNKIMFGSCYSIWLDYSENIKIINNAIFNGITGGIYMGRGGKDVHVEGNSVANNMGAGMFLKDIEGLSVRNNVVYGNAEGLERMQIMVVTPNGYEANGNLIFAGHVSGEQTPFGANALDFIPQLYE